MPRDSAQAPASNTMTPTLGHVSTPAMVLESLGRADATGHRKQRLFQEAFLLHCSSVRNSCTGGNGRTNRPTPRDREEENKRNGLRAAMAVGRNPVIPMTRRPGGADPD